jgi:PAS domain S-box-containing protein
MKKILRILVVEDSEDDALLVLHQFEKSDYDVYSERVDTADKMQDALREKTWDIVLSDYRMPHFNGLKALMLLQESGIDVPFIIISGTIGEETAVEAMKAGAQDYLMKSNLHRLLPAIERELREQKNRTERKLLERKQLEEEARKKSEEKFRYIFDNISEGIFLLEVTEDYRFRNLEMNSSFLALTGINRDDMIGKFIEETVPKETANIVNAKYLHCVESGLPIEEEVELALPVGKRIFLSSLIPICNETGRVYRIVGITRDITQRRKEEEERIKLSKAIEHSPVSIVITNSKGIIEYVNPFCLENTGYKHEELVGENPRIFKSGVTPIIVYKELWDTISSGNIWRGEISNKKKNGELFWERVNISPVTNHNNQITHYIGIKEDITTKKKILESLKESEEKHRVLFTNSPDAYLIIANGVFVDCNHATEVMLRGNRLQIVGQSPEAISPEFQPDGRKSSEAAAEKIKTALTMGINTFEWVHRRLDGTDFFVEVSIAVMVLDGQQLLFTTWRDITIRKRADAEIKLKNAELIKLNAEKDKFFSIIAHDLRSPFTAFLGLTQILVEKLPEMTTSKVQSYISHINNSATNLFSLLENLLEWSRQQQGLIPFNPTSIHLSSIVDECINNILESANNKGIGITCNIPNNLNVFADSNMLQTIIRNLVSNAVKFTPKGGNIILSAETYDNRTVKISIKDNGIGMNKEMINKLFRLDVKVNRAGTEGEPSTGLGLLLCKDFIEKHGGKIWVESEEGKGTIFNFIIT